LVLFTSCAAQLHIDRHSVMGPMNRGPATDRRIQDTCAATLHVVVTDDRQSPLAGIPVLAQIDSVETCSEERLGRDTFSTAAVLTDVAGRATTCEPTKILAVDEWNGLGGCASTRSSPRLVVGTGATQRVVKSQSFVDGMKVELKNDTPE
jgi:hypothetical protein